MILVRVREHDGVDGAPAVGEVRDVGEHEIDAEMLVAREREPRVDDEAAAVALDHRHVLSHLTEAAERDDANGISHLAPSVWCARFFLLFLLSYFFLFIS